MATGKKSAKTSKTAHVLNVITGAEASGETADSAAVMSPVRAPVAPILEVARANDDALEDTILNALTAEVEGGEPASAEEPAPAASPAQAPEAGPKAKPEAVNPPEPIPAPPAASPEETMPAQPEERSKPEADQAPQHEEKYYNITQALVEERAPKYMKMMGMCMCPRCRADVKALTLSNLPPKYIVMQPSQITPMFSVYEGKLGAAVTAQIISACRVVQDNPRHS